MNSNQHKRVEQPLRKQDINLKLKGDTEFGKDLNVEPETIGELPLMGGLKTREQVAIGEKMLIEEYRNKTKK